MGFGTIFASIMFVFVFASVVLFTATFQKSVLEASSQQQERNQDFLRQRREGMSITGTAYAYGASVDWVEDLYADFQGTTNNTEVTGDGSVQLVGAPYTNGTYTSQPIDSGFSSNYTTLSWTSVEPLNTRISFQLRSGNSIAALEAASFSGPDGTTSSRYTANIATINETLSPSRYVQYIAYFNTNDTSQTPQLQKIGLGIARPTGNLFINLTNSGSEDFITNQTDLYIQGIRIERNDTKRLLILHDSGAQAAWNPGELLETVVFLPISSVQSVIASNDAAKVAGSVSP